MDAASSAARRAADLASSGVDQAGNALDRARETAGNLGGVASEGLVSSLGAVRDAAAAAPTYAAQAWQATTPMLASAAAAAGGAASHAAVAAEAGFHMASTFGQEGFHAAAAAGGAAVNTIGVAGAAGLTFLENTAHKIPFEQWNSAAVAGISVLSAQLIGEMGKVFDWIRFDVLVSFWQMVSLFFSSIASTAIANAKAFFGNVANLFSVDWAFTIPAIPPVIVFGIVIAFAVVTLCFLCCSFCQGVRMSSSIDEIRQGPEAETWVQKAQKHKRTVNLVKYSLLAGMALYLPVTRVCIQVFSCDTGISGLLQRLGAPASCVAITVPGQDTNSAFYKLMGPTYQCQCTSWPNYKGFIIVAAVVFIFYSICFPLACLSLIKRNVPRGSTEDPNFRYNEDGVKVPYSDELYRRDLETDPRQQNNPFLALYDGYERQGKFYKIWSLALKAALIIPAVVLWDKTVPQVSICLVAMFLFTLYSSKSRPFLDPVSDFMEVCGRIAAFATALFGLIGSPSVAPGSSTVMGILINIINAVNFTIMGACFLMGIRAVRNLCKRMGVKTLEFSNTVNGRVGNCREIVQLGGGWDLRLETKHRIWHAFWDAFLRLPAPAPAGAADTDPGSAAAARSPGGAAAAKPEPQFGAAVVERFSELKAITTDVGKARIAAHFEALRNPSKWAQRQWLAWELEGTDVFWDGATQKDSGSVAGTRFGRMYTVPYPFHAVWVSDSGEGYAFLWEEDMDQFVACNTNGETLRRKGVRRQLRALAGQTVAYHMEREETHTVPDGEEHYTDKDGNRKTRQRYSSVRVHMTYNTGTVSVGGKRPELMSEGFNFRLTLTDGTGVAVAPHTGVHHTIRGTASLGTGDLGIDEAYNPSEQLNRLLSVNAAVAAARAPAVEQAYREYRTRINGERAAKENVMASAFWLHVYDADTLPRAALEQYFAACESNPALRGIPIAHRDALTFLYGRMSFARSHPCASLWFLFFDDVWRNNQHIAALIAPAAAALMNPLQPTSLAYSPQPRAALEAKLDELKLRGRFGLFTREVLDILYKRMEAVDRDFITSVQQQHQKGPGGPQTTVIAVQGKPTDFTGNTPSGASSTGLVSPSGAVFATENPVMVVSPASGDHTGSDV